MSSCFKNKNSREWLDFNFYSKSDMEDLLPALLFVRDYSSVKKLLSTGIQLTRSSLNKFAKTEPQALDQLIFRLPEEDELMILLYLLPERSWDSGKVANNKTFYTYQVNRKD